MSKSVDGILAEMRNNPGVRFADAMKLCRHFFGEPRKSGSHRVFRTPWPGDPRVNLQEDKGGKTKAYQIRQVVRAVERLMLEGKG